MSEDDARANALERQLTPELQRLARLTIQNIPKGWGFATVLFPFSDTRGEALLYISNAQRDDIVRVMTEFIHKQGGAVPDPQIRIAQLEALVREAAEWSSTPMSEDEDYGWRHCCDTADWAPHADGCKFAEAIRGGS